MTIDIIPVAEERQWLGASLRELIDRAGWEQFLRAPILRPSPHYFPDRWNGTVADVHRLTQRLMHHAGLGQYSFSLSAFEEDQDAYDRGTAGWFYGIEDHRCFFGVNVRQLKDPEAAVGVMAHEVAHAWRTVHELVEDDRDTEEFLTDLTTIYLGFGIFTANNTDRYRSYGDVRATYWSVSSAGYLPPPAMSWVLALQAHARNEEEVGDDLEPNQKQSFRAALHEMQIDDAYREQLALPNPAPEPWPYELIRVREPGANEAEEPEPEEIDHLRNAGVTVYRLRKHGPGSMLIGLYLGAVAGLVAAWLFYGFNDQRGLWVVVAGAFIGLIAMSARVRYICSAQDCQTPVTREMNVCPGCGGMFGGNIGGGKLHRVREQQLEQQALADAQDECEDCQPEEPCARHA